MRRHVVAIAVGLAFGAAGIAGAAGTFPTGSLSGAERADTRAVIDWWKRCVRDDVVLCTTLPTVPVPSTTTTTRPPSTTTVPPSTTTVPATTTTRPPVSSGLHVEGWHIKTGSGAEFVPIGANVGVLGAFDWHGIANGHAAQALQWGWNTIRLNVCAGPSCYWTNWVEQADRAQQVIDEYTAAGIVVMVADHSTLDPADQDAARQMLTRLAAANRANSRVWFNGNNEPGVIGADWNALCVGYYDLIRAAGNPNIVVCDAPADANDGTWDPAPHLDDPTGAATVNQGRTNIVYATHNYGGHGSPGQEDLAPYIARVRALNVAVLVGEFGYRVGQTDGMFTAALQNMDAYRTLGLGILVWHGTHGDGFYVRADPCPFYEMSCALTDLGSRLWALTH